MRKIALLLSILLPLGAMAQGLKCDFESVPNRTKGIDGQALDLTSDAPKRSVVVIDSGRVALGGAYTVSAWVKTPSGQRDSKVIVTNIIGKGAAGFVIGSSADGSWYAALDNGRGVKYSYEPTPMRQSLDDGRWHQLVLGFDPMVGEARFYYDGQNVATYNIESFSSVAPLDSKIIIGGAADNEWEAFNGLIDKLEIRQSTLTPQQVASEYHSVMVQAAGDQADRRRIRPRRAMPTASEAPAAVMLPKRVDTLSIMAFNIWHGGNETGSVAGPERVVDLIRDSGADVVGLIETYGSGARIADALGYYLYLHSSNLSILSRYPIVDTHDLFRSFNCAAVTLQVSATQKVNYINLWLHYLPSTHQQITDKLSSELIVEAEWTTRAAELKAILHEADSIGFLSSEVPTYISGDFNSDSHLDWTAQAKSLHRGYELKWPTSELLYRCGFTDSFRKLYPDPVAMPGFTWSPMATGDELLYRIDFIYYKGNTQPLKSWVVDSHPVCYPSDHAALVTVFSLD